MLILNGYLKAKFFRRLTKHADSTMIGLSDRRNPKSPSLQSHIESITSQLIAKYKPEKIIIKKGIALTLRNRAAGEK
jgi:hypothetical protein